MGVACEGGIRTAAVHRTGCTVHPADCTIHPADCTIHPADYTTSFSLQLQESLC